MQNSKKNFRLVPPLEIFRRSPASPQKQAPLGFRKLQSEQKKAKPKNAITQEGIVVVPEQVPIRLLPAPDKAQPAQDSVDVVQVARVGVVGPDPVDRAS